jgi:hypothetical protein
MAAPRVKALKDQWDGKYVYTIGDDAQTVYRRLVGGLAWSGPECRSPSSALCVLAEQRDKDFATGQHVIRVVYESMAASVEELLDEAAGLQDTMKCLLWATPLDAPEQVRVQHWTRARAQRRAPRLTMVSPPEVDFMVLHNLALKRTSAHKTMFFGEGSLAATQYVGVRADDFYRPVRIFPHVAACLYPLATLDMRPPNENARLAGRQLPAEGGY